MNKDDKILFHKMDKIEIIQVWKAHGDGGERSIGPVIAVCSDQFKAEVAAKNQGWYGGDGYVCDAYAIRWNDKVYLLESKHPVDLDLNQAKLDEEFRQATLAKLTDKEKKILGLK